jgi:hypothetical protein
MRRLLLIALVLLVPALVDAQPQRPAAGENREQGVPGSAGPKSDGSAVQHGTQPNPAEVRPGNRDGDSPSAAAGTVIRDAERRILGLPVTAALVIVGVVIVLAVVAGVVIPGARRRAQARGNGTYGRP